ncbi:hypothetical protein ABBQ38_012255 [Trebouxia sp. C0009 RCD-2024]
MAQPTIHLLPRHSGYLDDVSGAAPPQSCRNSDPRVAMARVVNQALLFMLTKHRMFPKVPATQRKAPSAWPHVSQQHSNATGRACKRREVSCQLYKDQHTPTQEEGPDISGLDPALQRQWDHAANAYLGNIVIKPQSNKKVRWTCDQCPDGHVHSWSARVQDRTNGTGCSQCSGRAVCKHNSLATKAPLVAAQWDYEANDGTPDTVVAHSNHKAKWHCEVCGCKWEATPNDRIRKRSGCKQCADNAKKAKKKTRHPTFAECKHPLLAEWDHQRNAAQGHYPDNIRLRSQKQISWLCNKCPAGQEHSWCAQPYSRTGRFKAGCPYCAGMSACKCNSLQALYFETAAEWDYSRNQGQPSDYPASSGYLAWWCNPQHGSWQQSINARTNQVHQKTARLRRIQQRQNLAKLS